MSDFPRSLMEFQQCFPDEAACVAYLFAARWPDGFVCSGCGKTKAWELQTKRWTWECAQCGRQTSVTAGTIMHHSKLPLTTWFWAAYLMATHGPRPRYRPSVWDGIGWSHTVPRNREEFLVGGVRASLDDDVVRLQHEPRDDAVITAPAEQAGKHGNSYGKQSADHVFANPPTAIEDARVRIPIQTSSGGPIIAIGLRPNINRA